MAAYREPDLSAFQLEVRSGLASAMLPGWLSGIVQIRWC
jgi:hypothetical protein